MTDYLHKLGCNIYEESENSGNFSHILDMHDVSQISAFDERNSNFCFCTKLQASAGFEGFDLQLLT